MLEIYPPVYFYLCVSISRALQATLDLRISNEPITHCRERVKRDAMAGCGEHAWRASQHGLRYFKSWQQQSACYMLWWWGGPRCSGPWVVLLCRNGRARQ